MIEMKKFCVFIAITLCVGFVSCSEEEFVVSGEEIVVPGENDDDDSEKIPVLEDSAPSAVIPSSGFYVANEDWFGHDNGTVNYFKKDGSVVYRAYRAANADETFGTTTQFATIYGDYAYFVSKQGNRLVVADAKTLKKKAVFPTLGGDGRFFVGVNEKLGYIGHSSGLRQFDIEKMQLGDAVEGVTGEIGTMCYAEGHVFVISRNKLYVVSVADSKVEKTLSGSFYTLTCSKDGTVWVATSDKFIKINPRTLEQEEMAYPNGVAVASPWFAWNAGSLCASTQNNVLYWAKGSSWSSTIIVKYDIDSKEFNEGFYTLGKSDGQQQVFYGAGLRVDPLTDQVIATFTRSGYGDNYNYNWVHMIRPDGSLEKEIILTDDNDANYYWFPAIPYFEDNNLPEILVNQVRLAPGTTQTVDLNKKIMDADNMSVSITREVELVESDLVSYTFEKGILTVTAKAAEGSTKCKVIATSNGKRVEKEIRVDVVAD